MTEGTREQNDQFLGAAEPAAVALSPADARQLRISWWSPIGQAEIARQARNYSDLAWRIQGTDEYVVGGLWRGRADVGMLVQLGGKKQRQLLVDALLAAYRARRVLAVLLSDPEINSNLKWYLQNGWRLMDEIVEYERPHCQPLKLEPRDLDVSPFKEEDLDRLMDVDHAAFPWLWWNDPNDFLHYVTLPGVHCLVARKEGELVGYVSFTVHGRNGHLDRIAVTPNRQRLGYGAHLLSVAIEAMAKLGARDVALTTQSDNQRSQGLYEKHGFRASRRRHRIYGIWLNEQGGPK